MHSGHYFAFCKNDENKKWFLFNDAVVSEIENPAEEVNANWILLFLYLQKKFNILYSIQNYFENLKIKIQIDFIEQTMINIS